MALRVKRVREILGVSSSHLAKLIGLSRQGYWYIETTDRAKPDIDYAIKINAFLREVRNEKIKALKQQIEVLETLEIDETLYLEEEE